AAAVIKVKEQAQLTGAHWHWRAVDERLVSLAVQFEGPETTAGARWCHRWRSGFGGEADLLGETVADTAFDPQRQLTNGDRLSQIFVRSELEGHHPGDVVVGSAGHHDHGASQGFVTPDLTAHIGGGDIREQGVDDDHLRTKTLAFAQARG